MGKRVIQIIEDEEDIRDLLRFNLEREGFLVFASESGESFFQTQKPESADLILLDLMLPGIDGLEVCRRLKSDPVTKNVPVIILTAKGEEADIVTGLELGADDYIIKPFSPRVLLARIKTVFRREKISPATTSDSTLEITNLSIHPGRHEVTLQGNPLNLTLAEFRILHFLAQRPGWVFTRNQLVAAVHGDDYVVTPRSVDVLVVGLRKKLKEAGNLIETVRGVGYRFRD